MPLEACCLKGPKFVDHAKGKHLGFDQNLYSSSRSMLVFGHECCFEKVPKFPTDLDFKGTLGSHLSYKNLVVIYLKFLEGRIDTGINNQ